MTFKQKTIWGGLAAGVLTFVLVVFSPFVIQTHNGQLVILVGLATQLVVAALVSYYFVFEKVQKRPQRLKASLAVPALFVGLTWVLSGVQGTLSINLTGWVMNEWAAFLLQFCVIVGLLTLAYAVAVWAVVRVAASQKIKLASAR